MLKRKKKDRLADTSVDNVKATKEQEFMECTFDKLLSGYGNKTIQLRRDKNLPHHLHYQISHLHLRNNSYRESSWDGQFLRRVCNGIEWVVAQIGKTEE